MMSEKKTGWTPGEWRADRHPQHNHSRWGELWLIHAGDPDDDGDPYIAQVHDYEAEANAHLMAAAPELYSEGAALSRQLRAVIRRLDGQAYSSTLSALNAFDAILAKARGEQS